MLQRRQWHPTPVLLPGKSHGCRKAAVHGAAEGRIWLSIFTFTFHFHALEKEMATHSSVLAWRIPGTAEPGGLPSIGSHRVGHDWSDLAAAAAYVLTGFPSIFIIPRLISLSKVTKVIKQLCPFKFANHDNFYLSLVGTLPLGPKKPCKVLYLAN